MGCIISISKALDSLRFTSLKKGVVHKADSIIILQKTHGVPGADVALVKLPNGSWTVIGSSFAANGSWAVMGYGLGSLDKNVLTSLVKAGAITQSDLNQHLERITDRRNADERKHALKQLNQACETLGIEPPKIPTSS